MEHGAQRQHFLLVTYPAQGHINPVLHLAKRLASGNGAAVTFSTAVSAHRKMFPTLATPDEEVADGLVTYIPFSDGFDEGFVRGTHDVHQFLTQFKTLGSSSVASILQRLDDRGRPVDCAIYTFCLPWVADVARCKGIPSAQYWIQPAAVFAIYYHYFHGYTSLVSSACSKDPTSSINLPGLPSLQARDLPSFLTISSDDDPYVVVLNMLKDTFDTLDRERTLLNSKPKVLMNTFVELEEDALSAVGAEDLTLIPIGPTLSAAAAGRDLFELDHKGYMEWLDSKPDGSVVYVSFGSMAVMKKKQVEEILYGIKESERPYLWVLRKDCRWEGLELEEDDDENGMVVEWCSQVKVLSHPSVGCFVTHCGWNSIVESLVCGVPTVGVPQWTDQGTNAMLVEKRWGTGVRGEVNGDGVLEREELKRCLDLVMGEGETSVNIKKNVELWRDKARETISAGGSSYQNLRKYVDEITKISQKKNF